jgi:hypothetical protein
VESSFGNTRHQIAKIILRKKKTVEGITILLASILYHKEHRRLEGQTTPPNEENDL